jgi:soluble lytic murein transglycosylase-like protein
MFVNENAYDLVISEAVKANGNVVSVQLVKAIIATESQFKPTAYRAEVKIGDASRGLMQILLKTAQGVGFTGAAAELFDPKVNLTYGVKFLSQLVRSKPDTLSAISAYNNGNGRRAKVTTPVCLARDGTGKCVRTYIAQPGEFLNQPYVNKVLGYLKYFGGVLPPAKGGMTALGAILVTAFILARKAGAFP